MIASYVRLRRRHPQKASLSMRMLKVLTAGSSSPRRSESLSARGLLRRLGHGSAGVYAAGLSVRQNVGEIAGGFYGIPPQK